MGQIIFKFGEEMDYFILSTYISISSYQLKILWLDN